MDSDVLVEGIGYLASVLLVISITQRSILRLRLVGFVAAVFFVVYSLIIGAYPIAIVNTIVAGIHLWYLRKLTGRQEEVFRILHVDPDSKYMLDFLDYYRDEIQGHYQPDFAYEPDDRQVTAFILRDMVPAGLFIGAYTDADTFEVHLDFVIPQYRDFRIGRFVYSPQSGLLSGTATHVVATAIDDDHAKYLARMGFHQSSSDPRHFEIDLAP
jgi:hypothetical protein